MTAKATCYMCASEETSREHAPPLCFFPNVEAFGQDLRRNLITVPSCDLHNSKKSKDDEFLRTVVLMTAESSPVGRHLFFGKLLRAVRRASHVYESFFSDKGTVEKGRGRALQLDRERFDQCIDRLARALFFDTFKEKWALPIHVVSPNFISAVQDEKIVPHEPSMPLIATCRQYLLYEPIKGENPDAFMYRIRRDETAQLFALAAVFYKHFEIFTFSSKGLTE